MADGELAEVALPDLLLETLEDLWVELLEPLEVLS